MKICSSATYHKLNQQILQIQMEELTVEDYSIIMQNAHGKALSKEVIEKMLTVNSKIEEAVHRFPGFACTGGPFEFNLRDLLRWADVADEVMNTFSFHYCAVCVLFCFRI